MTKKTTFLIALISLLTPILNISYAEGEKHDLNFSCLSKSNGIEVSWERVPSASSDKYIAYGNFMVRSDGPWESTIEVTERFYPEHYQAEFGDELFKVMAFENDVNFDAYPSGSRLLELPMMPGHKYYCAVGYSTSAPPVGSLSGMSLANATTPIAETEPIPNTNGSFGSDCGFAVKQPSKFSYHLELVNKNTKQRDGLCRVLTYRAENQGASTAKITGMTEYSLDVSVSNGDRFTVYVEKDGEAINQYFEVGSSTGTTAPTTGLPPVPYEVKTELPPAGYEDKVLTAINSYKNPFPDTNINELSGQAAAELYRRAIIGGYPDGEFKGYKPVNRAEAAKFLLLARFGTVADVANSGKFRDVLDGQWYTKFVVTAAIKGIINGYPDGSFKPADTVNTAEFLKMLTLTFGLEKNLSHTYTDVQPTDWFAQYAGTAKKYNLFPNRTSQLLPGNELTREEVAVGIYQYLLNR